MRSQSLAALGALAIAAGAVTGCASGAGRGVGLRMQQPPLPADQAAAWGPQDRLYRSLTLDYVSGMEPSRFRPVANNILDRAGLLAPTPAAARYALQVEFTPTNDEAGRGAWGSYRILNRATNQIVFEGDVPASFRSLGAAYWNSPADGAAVARRGVLAQEGYVTGYGQTERQVMTQSLTRFIIKLGRAETVRFAVVVPCLNNAEVRAIKGALTADGVPWRTDDCVGYHQRNADDGVRFTSFQ